MNTLIPFSMEENKWKIAGRKTKKNRKTLQPKAEPIDIELDDLCSTLISILSQYRQYSKLIVAGFLYGSRARKTNRPDSDADILIFWKHELNSEDLRQIRDKIEDALGIQTDFISCYLTKKCISHLDSRDDAYFGNVIVDAIQFMGIERLDDLILKSVKLPKLVR